ncbi:MAG: Flp pilus assembly pilin Flp [Polaromonas sp.]|jgi:Flp pilus assembly pilin Flp
MPAARREHLGKSDKSKKCKHPRGIRTMKLFKLANTFSNDESGAVTVDWVVLTAAIVGLGIAVYGVVSGGIADLSQDIDTQLTGQAISTSF